MRNFAEGAGEGTTVGRRSERGRPSSPPTTPRLPHGPPSAWNPVAKAGTVAPILQPTVLAWGRLHLRQGQADDPAVGPILRPTAVDCPSTASPPIQLLPHSSLVLCEDGSIVRLLPRDDGTPGFCTAPGPTCVVPAGTTVTSAVVGPDDVVFLLTADRNLVKGDDGSTVATDVHCVAGSDRHLLTVDGDGHLFDRGTRILGPLEHVPVVHVSVAGDLCTAVTATDVYVWGDDARPAPAALPTLKNRHITSAYVRPGFGAAVSLFGEVWTWGTGTRLGRYPHELVDQATLLPAEVRADPVAVRAAEDGAACATDVDMLLADPPPLLASIPWLNEAATPVRRYGKDEYASVPLESAQPTVLSTLRAVQVRKVVACETASYFVTDTGELYAAGDDRVGELGVQSAGSTGSYAPLRVGSLFECAVADVSADGQGVLAIAASLVSRPVRDKLLLSTFLSTQRAFLRKLRILVDVYARPLTRGNHDDLVRQKLLLADSDQAAIFGGLEEIYSYWVKVQGRLDAQLAGANLSVALVGSVFHDARASLAFDDAAARAAVATVASQNRNFREHIRACEEVAQAATAGSLGDVSLDELLLAPSRRVAELRSALERILRQTPGDHPDTADLQRSVGLLARIAAGSSRQPRIDIEEAALEAVRFRDIAKSLEAASRRLAELGQEMYVQEQVYATALKAAEEAGLLSGTEEVRAYTISEARTLKESLDVRHAAHSTRLLSLVRRIEGAAAARSDLQRTRGEREEALAKFNKRVAGRRNLLAGAGDKRSDARLQRDTEALERDEKALAMLDSKVARLADELPLIYSDILTRQHVAMAKYGVAAVGAVGAYDARRREAVAMDRSHKLRASVVRSMRSLEATQRCAFVRRVYDAAEGAVVGASDAEASAAEQLSADRLRVLAAAGTVDEGGVRVHDQEPVTRDYADFVRSLLADDLAGLSALVVAATASDQATSARGGAAAEAALLSDALVVIERYNEGGSLRALAAAIRGEVSRTTAASTLFRTNTISTKLMRVFVKERGSDYLEAVLGPLLRRVVEEEPEVETDPRRSPCASDNVATLITWSSYFFNAIVSSLAEVPLPLRHVGKALVDEACGKFGPSVRNVVLTGYFMLRFVCPALMTPAQWDLLPAESCTADTSRRLLLISKVLQNIANNVSFKEDHMGVLNDEVAAKQDDLDTFYNDFLDVMLPGDGEDDDAARDDTRHSAHSEQLVRLHTLAVKQMSRVSKALVDYEAVHVLPPLVEATVALGEPVSKTVQRSRNGAVAGRSPSG